jgi:hypothetical protein
MVLQISPAVIGLASALSLRGWGRLTVLLVNLAELQFQFGHRREPSRCALSMARSMSAR